VVKNWIFQLAPQIPNIENVTPALFFRDYRRRSKAVAGSMSLPAGFAVRKGRLSEVELRRKDELKKIKALTSKATVSTSLRDKTGS
jgi:hypothetical protein